MIRVFVKTFTGNKPIKPPWCLVELYSFMSLFTKFAKRAK